MDGNDLKAAKTPSTTTAKWWRHKTFYTQISFCAPKEEKKKKTGESKWGKWASGRVDAGWSVTEINFGLNCANRRTPIWFMATRMHRMLAHTAEMRKNSKNNLLKIQTFTIWPMAILRWMQKAKIALHRCSWRWNSRKICAATHRVPGQRKERMSS